MTDLRFQEVMVLLLGVTRVIIAVIAGADIDHVIVVEFNAEDERQGEKERNR